YGTSAQLDAAFQTLFQNTRGVVIFPENDSRLCAIAARAGLRGKIIDHIFFGSPNSEIFGSLSEITRPQNDSLTGSQRLAYAVLCWLRAKDPKIAIDLSHRQSNKIARRNQFLGTLDEVDYWSDYAHHPTEVLHCMRSMESRYKDVAFVFEPHRYTRTAQYAQEFANTCATRQVDLLPVYAAGEQSISSGQSETIFKKLPQQHDVRLISDVRELRNPDKKKQAVVFVGAGSIHAQAERWFREQRIESLIQWLDQENILYQTDVSSRFFSSIHIAGQLRLLICPNDKTQLMRLNAALKRYQVKWMLLGNGTNVLLDYDEGVFVSLRQLPREIQISGDRVIASANLPLPYFCRCLARAGITDYVALAGIPGTLGGALRMNAGAYGQEIFNQLTELEVLPFNGDTLERHTKSMIKYAYRQGFRNGVILNAQFAFSQSRRQPPEEIVAAMERSRTQREQSQPKEPNIGCIFKNPPQSSAGSLIDQCGLKGFTHGDAKVSKRHANFIVNTGNATPDDVKYLIKTCRQRVFEMYGVYLQREILFASDFF
ncbi:MAG: UDP-N-acetylmuramate dehydrogenase, partial [Opitutales bacterium]|nr:UDP-N-acetylmuramate dehydrogenase [Opitutales bacterium]